MRAGVVLAAAVLAGVPAAAQPVGAPERLCGLPQVVHAVTVELDRRRIAGVLDARNPGEVSLPDGSGASCAAWLVQTDIDTNAPRREQVRNRTLVQNYRVRRLSHSFLVELTE